MHRILATHITLDFGFSNIMVPGERFSTFCGSVSYVAPEIIKNIKYVGPEIDIWSMGKWCNTHTFIYCVLIH